MAKEIKVFWVKKGLEPLTSYKSDGKTHDTLIEAVNYALSDVDSQRGNRCLPWLRAGAGVGAAIFNYQAILLLKEAYDEGRAANQ